MFKLLLAIMLVSNSLSLLTVSVNFLIRNSEKKVLLKLNNDGIKYVIPGMRPKGITEETVDTPASEAIALAAGLAQFVDKFKFTPVVSSSNITTEKFTATDYTALYECEDMDGVTADRFYYMDITTMNSGQFFITEQYNIAKDYQKKARLLRI